MLITIITMVLVDINNEKFSQVLMTSVRAEVVKSNKELNEQNICTHKYEKIMSTLCSQVKMETDQMKFIEIKDSLMLILHKEKALQSFFTQSNISKLEVDNEKVSSELSDILKELYDNYLRLNYFDERVFLFYNKQTDCSPVKMTPFKRQKLLNNYANEYKQPAAFKALNFDSSSKNIEPVQVTRNINSRR